MRLRRQISDCLTQIVDAARSGFAPTFCKRKHGSNVTAKINKTSFAPGETMTFTINAGTRTGWWRAGVVDQAGNVVKTASVASGTNTTVTARPGLAQLRQRERGRDRVAHGAGAEHRP